MFGHHPHLFSRQVCWILPPRHPLSLLWVIMKEGSGRSRAKAIWRGGSITIGRLVTRTSSFLLGRSSQGQGTPWATQLAALLFIHTLELASMCWVRDFSFFSPAAGFQSIVFLCHTLISLMCFVSPWHWTNLLHLIPSAPLLAHHCQSASSVPQCYHSQSLKTLRLLQISIPLLVTFNSQDRVEPSQNTI